jgi:23S rRNA U2552 (ribose-2'-O)-methylase RlmE/FtsJ
MQLDQATEGKTVLVLAACRSPGPQAIHRLAQQRARIVAIDRDPGGLLRMAKADADRIETITADCSNVATLRHFRDAWGKQPLDVLLDLSPLVTGRDLDGQIRALIALYKATGRGLIAARGAMITLVGRPVDRLDIEGHARVGALCAAQAQWAAECARFGVRVHTLIVPQDAPCTALSTTLFLAATREVASGPLYLAATGTGAAPRPD